MEIHGILPLKKHREMKPPHQRLRSLRLDRVSRRLIDTDFIPPERNIGIPILTPSAFLQLMYMDQFYFNTIDSQFL